MVAAPYQYFDLLYLHFLLWRTQPCFALYKYLCGSDFQIHRDCWNPLFSSTFQSPFAWKTLPYRQPSASSEWSQCNTSQCLHLLVPLSVFLSSFWFLHMVLPLRSKFCVPFTKNLFQQSLSQHPAPIPAPTTPTKLLQLLCSPACFTCWVCTPENLMLLWKRSGLCTRSWWLPGRTDISKLAT